MLTSDARCGELRAAWGWRRDSAWWLVAWRLVWPHWFGLRTYCTPRKISTWNLIAWTFVFLYKPVVFRFYDDIWLCFMNIFEGVIVFQAIWGWVVTHHVDPASYEPRCCPVGLLVSRPCALLLVARNKSCFFDRSMIKNRCPRPSRLLEDRKSYCTVLLQDQLGPSVFSLRRPEVHTPGFYRTSPQHRIPCHYSANHLK